MNRREFFRNSFGLLALATVLPLVGRRYTPTLDWLDAAWRREVTGRSASAHPWGMSVNPRTFERLEREIPALWRFTTESMASQPNLMWRGCVVRPIAYPYMNDNVVMFHYKTDSEHPIRTRAEMIGTRVRSLPIRWFTI